MNRFNGRFTVFLAKIPIFVLTNSSQIIKSSAVSN